MLGDVAHSRKTWTFKIHMLPTTKVKIGRHPVFKTFQACLVNSASKLHDNRGKRHNFLRGHLNLDLTSGGEEMLKPLGLRDNVKISLIEFVTFT